MHLLQYNQVSLKYNRKEDAIETVYDVKKKYSTQYKRWIGLGLNLTRDWNLAISIIATMNKTSIPQSIPRAMLNKAI